MGGSFPWSGSSSPWVGFGCCGRGPGEGPLDGDGGGVGGRGGGGPRGGGGEGDRFGNSHVNVLLTNGDGVVSAGGNGGFAFGFGVVVGNDIGSLFIGVVGCVVTNFRSYGDSVDLGSVGLMFGSAQNMRRRRSSVQYRSSGVGRHGSSSFFISAAGSSRTAC